MNAIIKFLRGEGPDDKGRTLNDILNLSNEQLEQSHDVIQWLFPLTEPSHYNEDAPVLTDSDVIYLKSDDETKAGILKSYNRFMEFYKQDRWSNLHWISLYNHNYLRITRILKCLTLAGMLKERDEFKNYSDIIYVTCSMEIGKKTKRFWDDACGLISTAKEAK